MEWLTLVIAGAFGVIGYWFRAKLDALRAEQERLEQRRKELFTELLEPYVRLFAGIESDDERAEVIQHIKSVDYRRTSFHLVLTADDKAVRAYNAFMQYVYQMERQESSDSRELMRRFGLFMLALRRGLGNKRTRLDEWNMLEFIIKDMGALKSRTPQEPAWTP